MGEAELFLGIWGAKANNFMEKKKLFSGSWGRSMYYFQGSREHISPPHPGGPHHWTGNQSMIYIAHSQIQSNSICASCILA